MTEFEQATTIANKVLDRVSADPDDDLAVLARQFLRACERGAAVKDFVAATEKMINHEDHGGDDWWIGWDMLKAAHAKATGTA